MLARRGSIAFGTAVLLVVVGPLAVRADCLVRAALADGRVYTAPLNNVFAREPAWNEVGGYFTLLTAGVRERDPSVTLRLPSVVEGDPAQPVLQRWQLDRKRVHFVRYARPFHNGVVLPHYARESYLVSAPLDVVIKFTAPIRETLADGARLRELDRTATSEEAGPGVWRFPLIGRVTPEQLDRVNFDFLPASDGRYEWYASVPDGEQNRVTRWGWQPGPKKGEAGKWTEFGTWAVDDTSAPFAVAAGDKRFFVTESGNVFAVPPGAKAGTPLKAVWDRKTVDALIHDADNGKWYAFTKDQYFEIADPIKPKAHTLDVRRGKTAEEASETAAQCGRVIRGLPEPKAK